MIVLRGYQQDAVAEIQDRYRRGFRSVLLVAPTGSGKTVIFSYIAHSAVEKGKRVLILTHRQELLDQVSRSLTDFATPHALIAADQPMRMGIPVQVASVFTLVRRLDRVPAPDLIIVDEAHHATLSTTWGKVLAAYPQAKVLGVTATPIRLSGEGLGQCFQTMVLGPTVATLIGEGALCPFRLFTPPTIDTSKLLHSRTGDYVSSELQAVSDTATVTGDAVQHYLKHTPGRAGVVFCVSVQHAEHVAAQFTASGVPAKSIDGTLDRGLRRDIVGAFTAGRLQVLTSCDLISEGFDCPRVEVGISLRATQSLGLWLQQIGRCLRPFPGKEEAVLFDHSGNTVRHGWADDDREWSLDGSKQDKKARDEKPVNVRICPKCFAAFKPGRPNCTECGHMLPIKSRDVIQKEGELIEAQRQKMQKQQKRWDESKELRQAQTLEQLVALGEKRGYRNPGYWADCIMAGRQAKKERSMV